MEQNNILTLYLNKNRDYSGINNLTKFSGFNQNIFVDPATTGYGLIFVTKPSLFIYPQKPSISDIKLNLAYQNMCKDPKFVYFINGENNNEKDLTIVKQLSFYDFPERTSLFLPIFTNLGNSFNPNDTTIDTMNVYPTRSGYSIPVPTTKTASETAGTVSISVSETDNLDFLKMLKIWVTYISNITDGTFSANPDMINNNMLDYTCSIYYFMLGPDGKTLKYWCRYTSYPTTIPYSNLAYQKDSHNHIYYDINFNYIFKEDMDPRILEDFNMISLNMVSATFTNDNYTSFLENATVKQTNGYSTYINGNLLSKANLQNGSMSSIVTSPDRDPLIFYEPASNNSTLTDNTLGKYVMSFGNDTLNNEYSNSILEDPTAFSYSDLREKF